MYSFRRNRFMRKVVTAIMMMSFSISPILAGNIITVNNNNDSGIGSLREAIVLALSGDTVRFDPSLFDDTIKLTSGEIIINKSITINGLGDDSTIISGNNNSRIFRVNAGSSIWIEKLTLTQGMAADSGGAIYNNGILSVRFCTIENSTAKFGGALYNDSSLTISNCIIKNNFASSGQGGGVYSSNRSFNASFATFENNTSVSGGGAIASKGICALNNVTVTGNFSNRGGGIYAEGILIIVNSTIANNNANFGDGGGILNFSLGRCTQCVIEKNHVNNAAYEGGGIFCNSSGFQLLSCRIVNNTSSGGSGGVHNEGLLTIVNSSISDNGSSLSGGGARNNGELIINNSTLSGNDSGSDGGAIANDGELTINSSTLSKNRANGSGGGVQNSGKTTLSRCTVAFNKAFSNGGGVNNADSLFFSNTIIANDTADGQGDDLFNVSGKIISLGHNLVRDITPLGVVDITPTSTDKFGTSAIPIDPLLGPLQNNGGTMLTHEPLCGSPAIDAGDPAGALSTDQRDSARIHGAGIDIGSVESQQDPIELTAAIVHVSPPGNNNGSIELLISGGTPPYYVQWNNGDSILIITGLTAGIYTVTVEDFYGCSATAAFEVGEPNGIHNDERLPFTIYPNPVNDVLFIEYSKNSLSVSLFDQIGKEIKMAEIGSLQVPVDELPPGIYLLLLMEPDGKPLGTSRFIVMR